MSRHLPHTQTLSTDEISDERTLDETLTGQIKPENDRGFIKSSAGLEEDYPDGGLRAWLVVGGIMCSSFSTFGFVNAWGVFQAYYEEKLLKDSDASTIAWIGSIQYALVFMPSVVTGRMFDIGCFKAPLLSASIILVLATFLIAECTQYWHFLLCQGFAIGLSCGMVFGPSVGIIGHWFRHRRGIAVGLMSTGASVGGTVFPVVARQLIDTVGFPWTIRIIGCILILGLGIANLTMKRRLPPVKASGGILNLKAFRSTPYTIWCLSGFVAMLGLYTVQTYISVSATAYGVSPDVAFYLVSIANASSGVGRIVAGICVDRYGALNYFGPMTIIAGAVTYAWPFARSLASMIVVVVIYGFTSGAYISSTVNPIYSFGEISDVGRRTGMAFSIASLGAVAGPPISGAINTATRGFEAMGYYAGSTIMLAVVLLYVARYLATGTLRGRF
ncbi:major facilitator superfamily domain-containing protein [Desarmillaria tabescens]|uniref:Major facilitator superfamily domain-containing protein n=1 Tax=Armillaria tabescens TaxID=1929756 RepID=A0AA39U6A7_ARMTA|nr:major facilitator superfamily domain-containing protein [Desarmillaria tabescens]KAK0467835.1 major facilitator superfamily domain-containing protein [Desarmillaria tabescens]